MWTGTLEYGKGYGRYGHIPFPCGPPRVNTHSATIRPRHQEGAATDGNKLARELFGLFLIFWGLLLLLSLATFDARDPSLNHVVSNATQVRNSAGLFGSYIGGILVDLFGFSAFLWPFGFMGLGARYVVIPFDVPWWRWLGLILLGACVATLGAGWNLSIGDVGGGGFFGIILHNFAARYFSPRGSALVWLFLFLISAQLVLALSWSAMGRRILEGLREGLTPKAKPSAKLEISAPRSAVEAAAARPVIVGGEERLPDPAGTATTSARASRWLKLPGMGVFQFLWNRKRGARQGQVVDVTPAPLPAGRGVQGTPRPYRPGDDRPGASPHAPYVPQDPEDDDAYAHAVHDAAQPDGRATARAIARGGRSASASVGDPFADNEFGPGAMGLEDDLTGDGVDGLPNGLPNNLADGLAEDLVDYAAGEAGPTWLEGAFGDDPAREGQGTAPAKTARPRKARSKLPGLDLLHSVAGGDTKPARQILETKGQSVITCLADFGVQGELTRITPGPVVTMFEVRPAPGVKVSRIANLSDDLALALKAIAVRIQAPIPGTDTVGIEIPNEARENVCFKELLGSDTFRSAPSMLTMAIGKDIAGNATVADLARMPHLLVAGATGAGKSVCLNSILLSFLYKARPEDVQMLLVDPKRIELAVYADLPHLVHPVVTEMALAKNALDWAVQEMDRRYQAMARLAVRNIAGYNQKLADLGANLPPELADLERMPYLVIVIDELADLMLTAAKEVETSIVRLAQLARAAGIHMILATQRPSVDVVTGLIKANFPCRISFQVTSKHDSRTILDTVGAEHLLGKGDMLFKPSGGKLQRLHGAFVGDDDVAAVVEFWKHQQAPNYTVDFADWGNDGTGDGGNGNGGGDLSDDPMYAEAVEFVIGQGKASISQIQRRFRIGFNRAARYVEQMEHDGIIGPSDGSKPRMVIR
ncbi:DNA translocase FtsK [Nitratidesulfovibrio termitidis]|uniref:DNA translocase FtsK n=1 Tax=Nitratidesulfovibrio termitidis TaxID=42252 RepID=UPI000419F956|nr:DNA translocase FtsK [Nitratidesulfovibrio termitidis]